MVLMVFGRVSESRPVFPIGGFGWNVAELAVNRASLATRFWYQRLD